MHKLVLLRHGESTWNKANRFTGWKDVGLTETGLAEAKKAGELLKAEGFSFDVAHTSVLKRAILTLWLVLEELDLCWVPVVRSWRLNERHYGDLQGLNKSETAEKFGKDQVFTWLKPSGKFFLLMMQVNSDNGPPFHCDLNAMRDLFAEDRWNWQTEEMKKYEHPSGKHFELAAMLTRRG